MRVAPDALPLFVTVPTLLMAALEIVNELAVVVLLFSIRLPLPETPPEIVMVPEVSVKVVPLLLTFKTPLIASGAPPF